jgi:hypothetical protein
MKVFVGGLEAIAVLVPDFQTLGLIVPAFFSLYRCAVTLGFPGTKDINADLLISVVLGYAVAVVLNLASAVALPARPNPAPISFPELRTEESSLRSRSEHMQPQFVREGTEIGQIPGVLRKVQQ